MSFLLDTNLVSEWIKPSPNLGVVHWMADADEDRLFMSVITLTELRYGIERLAKSNRKKRLDEWVDGELLPRFEGRILGIDSATANVCGTLIAHSEATGRRVDPMDGFIAATAEVHGLTLVTHTVAHFQSIVTDLVDPWI